MLNPGSHIVLPRPGDLRARAAIRDIVSILPRVLTARPGLSIGTFELVALMENMTRIRRMLEGPPDLNRVLFDPLDLSEYL